MIIHIRHLTSKCREFAQILCRIARHLYHPQQIKSKTKKKVEKKSKIELSSWEKKGVVLKEYLWDLEFVHIAGERVTEQEEIILANFDWQKRNGLQAERPIDRRIKVVWIQRKRTSFDIVLKKRKIRRIEKNRREKPILPWNQIRRLAVETRWWPKRFGQLDSEPSCLRCRIAASYRLSISLPKCN